MATPPPQSLLDGLGGLASSHPHCAVSADGAVLLAPTTPLTWHLVRIQTPHQWALALGKHLSVQLICGSGWLCLCRSTSGKEPLSPIVDCTLDLATDPGAGWGGAGGWRTQSGFVLSCSTLGRGSLSPTVDCTPDLPLNPGVAPLVPR